MIVLPTLHDIDFLSGTSGENCLKVFFLCFISKRKVLGETKISGERFLGGFGARDGDELSCLELGVWKITLY